MIHSLLCSLIVVVGAYCAGPNLGAQPAYTTFQGGTGSTSPSGILYGDETIRLKTVTIGSNLTFSGGTLSATGGGGSGTVSTSTNETAGNIPYWTSTSGTPARLGSLATSTLTISGPFLLPTIRVIGASGAVTYTGLATTSQPSSSNLLVSNGGSGVYGTATTSLTISAPLTTSGTPGALVGGSNLTIDIDDIKAADLDLTDITLNDFTNDANFLTTVDISANTNLTAGDHITLTNDDLDVDDDFILNTGDTGTGLYTLSYASTTGFSTGYASSTLYFGANLSTCESGNMLTWSGGRFGCEDDTTAAGAANDFTFSPTFGAVNAATSSNVWVQGVLNASSTSNFTGTSTHYAGAVFSVGGVSASESAGGVINCRRLTAVGPCFIGHSAAGAGGGRLVSLVNTNTAYDTQLFHASSSSLTESTINAFGIVAGKGVIKATIRNGTHDSSAGSFDASDSQGQALFAKGNAGTTTPIFNVLDSGSNTAFRVDGYRLSTLIDASTTQLTVAGNTYLSALTSALVLAGADGLLSEYAGIDCTNQFVRDVSAAGAGTCATVGTADVSGLDISDDTNLTAGDHITLTGDDLDVDDDFILNTGDTGTGLYTLSYASTTGLSSGYASSTLYYGAGLANCASENMLTWTDGRFGCESDTAGAGGGWPFTPATYGSTAVQSTSTPLWLTAGFPSLIATSTFATYSSTTQMSIGAYGAAANIYFTEDGDGALTIKGTGNANSEDFTINLDDTADVGVYSSASGLVAFDFPNIRLRADGIVIDGDGTFPASADNSLLIGDGTDTGTFDLEDGPACIGDGGCTPHAQDGSLTIATYLGVGTSTFQSTLANFASSTAPQIALSDALGSNLWSMRNINGNFYLATSTFAATSTTPSITIGSDNIVSFGNRTATCTLLTGSAGLCDGDDGGGGGGEWPFTPAIYGATAVQSTSTPLWLTAGFPSLIATSTFATYASSTQLTNSGNTWLTGLTSALVLAGSDGLLGEYTGIDCTNQFVRDVDAAGAGTCATVGTADVSGLDISADTNLAVTAPIVLTDDTLSFAWAWPWTTTTNYGTTTNATTTKSWFIQGLTASSTSHFVYATTTALTVTGGAGSVDIDNLTSALITTGSTGILAEYAGAAACTNQFVTAIDALGATTCASINNAHWSGTDLSVANGGTGLSTFGGTNTVLFTTAADTLSSDTLFLFDSGLNLLGVGTSTPKWSGTFASSTGPQIGLSDGLGSLNWTFRNMNGGLYVATSTFSATSSVPALHIDSSGRLGIGTSSPSARLSVEGNSMLNGTTTTTGLNVLSPTVGTSTIYMYSKTAGFGGQIILEDVDAAGCTAISTLNGTVSGVTVTCPTEL